MQMMIVPHRKHVQASTASNGDSFTFLYVDYIRTSQETQAYTACYGINLLFYM
jgi:hypothetical protein